MLFSDAFDIQRGEADDWFDPFLNLDTKLFIDPFLLYDQEDGVFSGSHNHIIAFFNHVLSLIAQSGDDPRSAFWGQAESLLRLPEVEELCLGYTALGTGGSGSGAGIAHKLAKGLANAVRAGVVELRHFETVQIFGEGIGADRISDATANLIRDRLAAYTKEICLRHEVPLRSLRTDRAVFDFAQERWTNGTFELPENTINGKPVMLVPQRYLRLLPTINPEGFWDYGYDNHNEQIRRRYGQDITRNVNKETIVDLARASAAIREEYEQAAEAAGSEAYDLDEDTKGVYVPARQAYRWALAHPQPVTPRNDVELVEVAFTFVEAFRNFVENERGWLLLWNDNGTPKAEPTFQALIMQTVSVFCRTNNIEITPEANIGRGPVDFKLSVGHRARIVIEAKLARNTRFWHGLERQTPKYLQAEGISQGIFLVCVYNDADRNKVATINQRVASLNERLPYRIRAVIVDAQRNPPSASVL